MPGLRWSATLAGLAVIVVIALALGFVIVGAILIGQVIPPKLENTYAPIP